MIDIIAITLANDPTLFATVFVAEQILVITTLTFCILMLYRVAGDIDKIKATQGKKI